MGKRSKANRQNRQRTNSKKGMGGHSPIAAELDLQPETTAAEEARIAHRSDSLAAVASDAHVETRFFETELTPMAHEITPSDEEVEADRISQAHLAQARVRRATFSRYVGLAVAVSLGVCVAGAFRHYLASSHGDAVRAAAPALAEAPAVVTPPVFVPPREVAAVDIPAPLPHALVEPSTPVEKATESAPEVKKGDKVVEPKAELTQETAPAARGDATADRKLAERALDRGNVKGAIEAGERAVEADPTDGGAWLVLGAAYQMAGRHAQATKAFATCTKQAKKGPVGECRAMLR